MGATESKLTFRKGVFRLFEERVGTSERLCTSFFFKFLTRILLWFRIFEPLTSTGRK